MHACVRSSVAVVFAKSRACGRRLRALARCPARAARAACAPSLAAQRLVDGLGRGHDASDDLRGADGDANHRQHDAADRARKQAAQEAAKAALRRARARGEAPRARRAGAAGGRAARAALVARACRARRTGACLAGGGRERTREPSTDARRQAHAPHMRPAPARPSGTARRTRCPWWRSACRLTSLRAQHTHTHTRKQAPGGGC
jgi:hypothetical protein